MGRPKGSKNGVKKDEPIVTPPVEIQEEAQAPKEKPRRVTPEEMKAMEAKAHLRDKPTTQELPPLSSDQKYFEAPDGVVIVGEKGATRVWYRNLHGNGRGGWILEKR